MSDDILQWLKQWFFSRGKVAGTVGLLPADVDYFEAGWLTSMEVVELVTEIEMHFGIQFSDRDLQDSRFVTLGGLAELILACSTTPSSNG